jgi:hypothetical protein
VKIGISRTSITPLNLESVNSLSSESFKSVLDKIYCNVIALEFNASKAIFISLDLVWVDDIFCENLINLIKSKFIVNEENIVVSATHVHTSPQIIDKFSNCIFNSGEYRKYLTNVIFKAVSFAIDNMIKGYGEISVSKTAQNINRRKFIFNLKYFYRFQRFIANRPNKDGIVDDEIVSIKFYDNDDIPLGMFVNFSAHPTLAKINTISSDYPGAISDLMIKRHGKSFVTCFFQGFCGNIKPNIIKRNKHNVSNIGLKLLLNLFDRVTFQKNLSKDMITDYANKILVELDNPHILLKFNEINIKSIIRTVKLKTKIDSSNKEAILRIQILKIGPKFAFIAFNGEIFSEYSVWIRSHLQKNGITTMLNGYSGGMIGYIPTSKAINEGGYEVNGSLKLFGITTGFSNFIESDIKKIISETLFELKMLKSL